MTQGKFKINEPNCYKSYYYRPQPGHKYGQAHELDRGPNYGFTLLWSSILLTEPNCVARVGESVARVCNSYPYLFISTIVRCMTLTMDWTVGLLWSSIVRSGLVLQVNQTALLAALLGCVIVTPIYLYLLWSRARPWPWTKVQAYVGRALYEVDYAWKETVMRNRLKM